MPISTNIQLKSAIADYATRSDSVFMARVPDFIRLAELRIWRKLRVGEMIETNPLIVGPGTDRIALPERWVAWDRLTADVHGRNTDLEYLPPASINRLPWPGRSDRYSTIGRDLVIGQRQDAPFTVTASYYARAPYLAADTDTNWLLDSASDLYLYGALIESHMFAKSARVAEWGSVYDKAMDSLNGQWRAQRSSGSLLRERR